MVFWDSIGWGSHAIPVNNTRSSMPDGGIAIRTLSTASKIVDTVVTVESGTLTQ